ncbi:MarR family winged helix-turn-helix transcriptional regulator [Dongia soli]|uniref:MarR family winged helix-turn-helix transcriptional regulator n=1 Tax=Dongia soli TaxID=600628 RepID=A0ABU5E8Y4_9PROT|nr:MarR family winged helix-turn-helix transcriptional regulator [Dongia soli]MDY0882796.1 MarR family winged helix-turn-helix transcriptional regulator [Dongia soli]
MSPKATSRRAADAAVLYELESQIGFVLRRAHQRHVSIFADCMAELSLTPQQFSALVKIQDEVAVSQNRLGRLTAMDPATILGVVQRLIQRGLVNRSPDPVDPRSTRLTLTEKGQELVASALPMAREATDRTLAHLSSAERKDLQRLLSKLATGEDE